MPILQLESASGMHVIFAPVCLPIQGPIAYAKSSHAMFCVSHLRVYIFQQAWAPLPTTVCHCRAQVVLAAHSSQTSSRALASAATCSQTKTPFATSTGSSVMTVSPFTAIVQPHTLQHHVACTAGRVRVAVIIEYGPQQWQLQCCK
jgi:hypothetical protein